MTKHKKLNSKSEYYIDYIITFCILFEIQVILFLYGRRASGQNSFNDS